MKEAAPGILLVAEPFLKDPNFMRTVILLCDHQSEGSFGFVLNRIFDHTLDELMSEAGDLKIPVYYGGPVQMDTIHFLHQYPNEIPGSQEVKEGIYWGGDFSLTLDLIRKNIIDLKKIRFFIGYSGWGNGQLKDELKENSWLTVFANQNIVFQQNIDEIWKQALKLMGPDFEQMVNYPTDPQLN